MLRTRPISLKLGMYPSCRLSLDPGANQFEIFRTGSNGFHEFNIFKDYKHVLYVAGNGN